MRKMLAMLVMMAMVLVAGPVLACSGFGCLPEGQTVNISGSATQNAGGFVAAPPGATGVNNAFVSFEETSTGSYTANTRQTGVTLSGAASADGAFKGTTDLDTSNHGKIVSSEAYGSLSNDAYATVTGPSQRNMNAQVSGSGSLTTEALASKGVNADGSILNGAYGQTVTQGNFQYCLDPTKSVMGAGQTVGQGTAVVTSIPDGFKVQTNASSSASGVVNFIR